MENDNIKRLNALSTILSSGNSEAILKTIKTLRNESPFDGALHQLASLYDTTTDSKILHQIELFFNDIKESSVRDEIVVEIHSNYTPNTIKMLVASCWQSRLDYSEYLMSFAKLLVKATDYTIALECATVIEEHSKELSDEKRASLRETLLSIENAEFQPLVEDLVNTLL